MEGMAVRREVASGELTVTEAMEDPRAGSLEILALLKALRSVGRELGLKYLRRAGVDPENGRVIPVPEKKRVRDLTQRQREQITKALAEDGRR